LKEETAEGFIVFFCGDLKKRNGNILTYRSTRKTRGRKGTGKKGDEEGEGLKASVQV